MSPTAGIGAAAPRDPKKAAREAQLARGRATAAANRARKAAEDAARAEAAAGMSVDPEESVLEGIEEITGATEPVVTHPVGPRANLGISAARQAQSRRPGAVVGHTEQGRVIVLGRDGKPISRKGERNIDKFAVPKHEIPPGWSYQWIAETVLNEPQTAALMDFDQKQWRAVPQQRHPNHPVRQGGLLLVERPVALTEEARAEEMQEAKDQLKANVDQFTPGKGLRKTGTIRKGRPISVSEDGIEAPTLEIADDQG